METISRSYLTKAQAIEKYPFLTKNMLKNLLFKDIRGFRNQVATKIGRRVILDEGALLRFVAEGKEAIRGGENGKAS